MNEQRLIRLQRIEIEGLFGLYDHRVDLDHHDRVTLLHGPNGVGKTHTLGMVHALLTGDTGYFRRVPCRQCRLTFANSAGQLAIEPHNDRGELRLDQGGESQKQEIPLVGERRGRLSRSTSPKHPFLSSFEELPEDHPSGKSTLLRILAQNRDLPDWFLSFIKDVNVHFIGTHRLVLAGPSQEPWSNPWSEPWPVPRSNREHPVPTVSERSREFTELFRETMANYGRQAQTLDQTFPQRLVAAQASADNGDIRRRMAALKQETDQLKCLGILDEASEQPGHPLDEPTELDDTEARVMALYVDDTEKKLEALADLAERVRSLLESLNGKFRHKRLRIDRDEGFVAETDSGQKVPLDSLSSGEQHELVLHYDLLFRVRENTIVLIDEPELSLHVAWQKRFLPDLLDFTKLSAFDAIVATHSPYIIGERDDLMVGLSDQA
ncbi:MAG: AAA family ATPase [Acidobacteriota bacterium]|nr:AAA family ATPase [Acidobacteriota bacterium]